MDQNPEIQIAESGLLTRPNAAKYLNQTVRWTYRAAEHGIPTVKVGRSKQFLKIDLDNFIARNKSGGGM
jgi:hypothetical protein